MTAHTIENTLEGAVCPFPRERQKPAKRASSSRFAKRIWNSDDGRLTAIASGSGWARLRLFN